MPVLLSSSSATTFFPAFPKIPNPRDFTIFRKPKPVLLRLYVCIGLGVMGLFKRLSGFLGFAREEEQHHHDGAATPEAAVPQSSSGPPPVFASAQHTTRRGFSVPVQVPVDRGPPPPPLLEFCPAGDGGIQGLRWYARRLKIDEDGDIANEFLDEVLPDGMEEKHEKPLSRSEVKGNPRPAKVKNLSLLPNGKIHHLVDYQGRLEWM